MNQTITDVIVQGKSAEIIASMFHDLSAAEAATLSNEVYKKLEDSDVSEEDFQEFCDKIDAKYTSI